MTVISYVPQRKADLERKIKLGLHCSGYVVQQRAKTHAPVDTGLLRASITYQVEDDHVDIGVHAGPHENMHSPVPGHNSEPTAYFCYQELGTRRNKAHPYLRPGLTESRDNIEKCFSAAGDRRSVSF